MDNISLREIIAATNGKLLNVADEKLEINVIVTDSRKILPGCLFVALAGETFDGHDFVATAVEKGAAAVMVQREVKVSTEAAVILVPDTLVGLGDIAGAYRSRYNMPMVGITGSNGKTSTKDLVWSILRRKLETVKTNANFNNEIGVPLTLFNLSSATQAAVLEMGMRGIGQIERLASLVKPTIGIVTNVGDAHLELLGSRENIAKAKAELVQALPTNGLAILNGDLPLVKAMKNMTEARSVFYGISGDDLDYRATDIRLNPRETSFTVQTPGESFEVILPLPGEHNVMNALAAIAAATEMGFSGAEIAAGLSTAELSGKRLNILEVNGYSVIDDTYNASPISTKAALDVLKSLPGTRKIAVLGDMFELGKQSEQFHFEVGEYARKSGIQRLLCTGELAKQYLNGFGGGDYFDDKAALIAYLRNISESGDVILVKASHGMHFDEIVEALQKSK